MTKDNEIDYEQITEPSIYRRALQSEFGEGLAEVLDELMAEAKTELEKASQKSSAIERRRAMKKAQEKVDFLGKVGEDVSIKKKETSASSTVENESTGKAANSPVSTAEKENDKGRDSKEEGGKDGKDIKNIKGGKESEEGVTGKIRIDSPDEISDEDFINPTRDIELPTLPENTLRIINSEAKPVVIKKNVLEKNGNTHLELSPEDSRNILKSALYNPDLVGQSQPQKRSYYWLTIKTGDKNSTVVIDVYPTKDAIEVVGWRYINENGIEKLKRQAEREGGQILILSPGNGSAAALSALPSGLSKAEGITNNPNNQTKAVKSESASLTEPEAKALIAVMEQNAEDAPVLELTPENWYSEFGETGKVETPIGAVKMGENQYLKLLAKGRGEQFGMVKPTLTNPDVVIEKIAEKEGAERDTKLLFVKTFTDSTGKKHTFFESVTVKQDGLEVSVSNHIADKKAIAKELINGAIAYNKFANRSESYLPENQNGQPDIVPTQANYSADKGNGVIPNNQTESVKSESAPLTEPEAKALIAVMEQNAEDAPAIELTPENWYSEFGEDGVVTTPLGEAKMGENQLAKTFLKKREGEFGMIKPTLTNPDVIIEEPSEAADGETGRNSSYLFIKTFNVDGKKYRHFESVTVNRDNKEVVVSSHILREKQLLERLKAGRVVYKATALEASGQTSAEYTSRTKSGALSEGKDNEVNPNNQIDYSSIDNLMVVTGAWGGFTSFDNSNVGKPGAGTDNDVRPSHDTTGKEVVKLFYHQKNPFAYIYTPTKSFKDKNQYLVAAAGLLGFYGQAEGGRFGTVFVSVKYDNNLPGYTEEYLLKKAVEIYHQKFDGKVKHTLGDELPIVEYKPEYLRGLTSNKEESETGVTGIEKLKRQAEREGGQILILSPGNGSAAALSALPSGLSKAEGITNNPNNQTESVKSESAPLTEPEAQETDDNGIPFVKASDGTTVFGEINEAQARAIWVQMFRHRLTHIAIRQVEKWL